VWAQVAHRQVTEICVGVELGAAGTTTWFGGGLVGVKGLVDTGDCGLGLWFGYHTGLRGTVYPKGAAAGVMDWVTGFSQPTGTSVGET
jgi:hypothetical protein